jgi:uncharacterized repeat protein (TIGR01451 family)
MATVQVPIITGATAMKNSQDNLFKKVSNTLTINVKKTHEVTIMKMLKHRPPGHMKKAIGITAVLTLFTFLLPGTALATTASNAVISNTATVNYDDAGGNAQAPINASADVTVNLVQAAPTLSDETTATTPSGVAVNYTYTITNNSNGLDTYNLTDSLVANDAGITTPVPSVFRDAGDTVNIASIDLGATSLAATANATDTTITVPNDGTADASQNGIAVNDTINIGGELVVVSAVTDTGAGTDIITFGPALAGGPYAVGTQVGEVGTFIYQPTPTTSVSGDTVTLRVTASDGTNSATDDTITTVTLISLTVTKYVQNIDAPVVGSGGSVGPFDTGLGGGPLTYYVADVNGNPGETLEYVIVISNAAGSGTATDVIISDPLPNFTTFTGNAALDDDGVGGFSVSAGTAVDDNDFVEADASTIYIYAGAGGDDDPAPGGTGLGVGAGGSLPASTTTMGAFQVIINN